VVSVRRSLMVATGILCLSLGMIGCGGSTSGSGSTPVTPTPPVVITPTAPALVSGGAQTVYFAQTGFNGTDKVLEFPAGGNGSLTPSVTLSPNRFITALATDSSGQLYVLGYTIASCDFQVYAAGATSTSVPIRDVFLPMIGVNCTVPNAITVDASGSVYVGNEDGTIYVYSSTANGSATPVRTISGAATGIATDATIQQLAVDSSGLLYVSSDVLQGSSGSGTLTVVGTISVFAAGANGNVAPVRTIANSSEFGGLALDSSGNIFVVGPSGIEEFPSNASGAATPEKSISPGSLTNGFYLLQVDSVGNIYALTVDSTRTILSITAVPPSSSGVVSPVLTTTSSSLTAAYGHAMAVH
jgi:hypothetical protein